MTSLQRIVYQLLILHFSIIFGFHHPISRWSLGEHWNFESTDSSNTTQVPSTTEAPNQRVKITVYYETLCPASVDFVVDQLRPTVEQLGQHLDVHLVPYGHAKTRARNWQYRFKCQHGPEECFGNKLHACVIDLMQNSTKSVLLNACLMQHTKFVQGYGYDHPIALAWCAYKLHFSYEGVRQCVVGRRGNILLKRHGEETHSLRPRYVPYVMINDSIEDQDQATGNLKAVVCQKLDYVPLACRKH